MKVGWSTATMDQPLVIEIGLLPNGLLGTKNADAAFSFLINSSGILLKRVPFSAPWNTPVPAFLYLPSCCIFSRRYFFSRTNQTECSALHVTTKMSYFQKCDKRANREDGGTDIVQGPRGTGPFPAYSAGNSEKEKSASTFSGLFEQSIG